MKNKPHFKRIPSESVTVGMKILSPLLDESFTVETKYTRGATLFLVEGIYHASVSKRGFVWQEVN